MAGDSSDSVASGSALEEALSGALAGTDRSTGLLTRSGRTCFSAAVGIRRPSPLRIHIFVELVHI
jgi:hypothetical protein